MATVTIDGAEVTDERTSPEDDGDGLLGQGKPREAAVNREFRIADSDVHAVALRAVAAAEDAGWVARDTNDDGGTPFQPNRFRWDGSKRLGEFNARIQIFIYNDRQLWIGLAASPD